LLPARWIALLDRYRQARHGCYRRVGLLCSIAIGRRGTVATGGGFILLGCYRQALLQTPFHG